MPKWVFGSKSWNLGQNLGIWVKILAFGSKCWVFGSKYWVFGSKYWVSGSKYWVSGSKYWVSGSKYWVFGSKYWVFGSNYGIFVLCLALCTGYNLCASRRRTLRGLFFTKKSVLKMRNSGFPGF